MAPSQVSRGAQTKMCSGNSYHEDSSTALAFQSTANKTVIFEYLQRDGRPAELPDSERCGYRNRSDQLEQLKSVALTVDCIVLSKVAERYRDEFDFVRMLVTKISSGWCRASYS